MNFVPFANDISKNHFFLLNQENILNLQAFERGAHTEWQDQGPSKVQREDCLWVRVHGTI